METVNADVINNFRLFLLKNDAKDENIAIVWSRRDSW